MSEANAASESLALMPVAAVLCLCAIFSSISLAITVYSSTARGATMKSTPFLFRAAITSAAILAYGFVVGKIESSIITVFDPYDILAISTSANSTIIKRAYKKLSLQHHPDKGGSAQMFQQIARAYSSLTDATSMKNLKLHGHPDGPQTKTVSFAAPDWLLHPTGTTAIVMLTMYLAFFAYIIYFVYKKLAAPPPATMPQASVNSNPAASAAQNAAQNAMQMDIKHMSMGLNARSTHTDVLWWVASAPENLRFANAGIKFVEEATKKKMEVGIDLSEDGGWGDDADEDEEKKKKDEMERRSINAQTNSVKGSLASATIKLEGVDEGVVGMKWTQDRLGEIGAWPPKIDCMTKGKPSYLGELPKNPHTGKEISPLDKPEVARNMTMMMARLNAQQLGQAMMAKEKEGKLDNKFFGDSMQFRQRTGMLLDASLKMAVSSKNAALARTIVETMCLFKLGLKSTEPQIVGMFKQAVERQHGPGTCPALQVLKATIATPDEDEVAVNDQIELTMMLKRPHAKPFTRAQVMMLKMRKMEDAQITEALSKFREQWWIMLSCVRVDMPDGKVVDQEQLVLAWPAVVGKIDQEDLKLGLKFKAPPGPGKYTFRLDVKASEFLGCDSTQQLVVNVVKEARVKEEATMEDDGDVVVVGSPKSSSAKKNE